MVPAALAATFPWWDAGADGAVGEQRVAALRWVAAAALGAVLTLLFTRPVPPPRTAELTRRTDEFRRRLLYELARTSRGLEAPSWRERLHRRRREVERSLCRGLGRGTRRWRRRRALLLDDAWDQVVAIMEQRARGDMAPPLAGGDVDALIRRTLAAVPGLPAATGGDDGDTRADAGSDRKPECATDRAQPAAGASPALHEAATAAAAVPPAGRQEDRPRPASQQPPVTVPVEYEAAAFAEAVAAARRSVALEGGVYRIRKELYGGPLRRSLRQVAEGVITDEKLERLVATGRRQEWRMSVSAQGIRYDELLARYPDAREPATRSPALEQLRRSLGAAGAALLLHEDAAYRATRAVGSLAVLARSFVLTAGSPVYDDHLRARRYLVVESRAEGGAWERYAAALDAVEWGAGGGGRLAFLPAILDATPAYLLLADAAAPTAAPPGGAWDLSTLITRLNLHP